MKIFVFSDSHLTKKYDPEFVKWVEYWSRDVDKIIICGDFWDWYMNSWDKFVDSQWKDTLFPILKSKNAHYIYGNHDKKEFSDERANLFSDEQSKELDIELGDKIFHFEHGDRFGTPIDGQWWPFLVKIGYWYQWVVVGLMGLSFYKAKVFRDQIPEVERIWGDDKRILVCGHTHYGAKGDNYFVLQPSVYGLRYGLIIDDGKLTEVHNFAREGEF